AACGAGYRSRWCLCPYERTGEVFDNAGINGGGRADWWPIASGVRDTEGVEHLTRDDLFKRFAINCRSLIRARVGHARQRWEQFAEDGEIQVVVLRGVFACRSNAVFDLPPCGIGIGKDIVAVMAKPGPVGQQLTKSNGGNSGSLDPVVWQVGCNSCIY